MVRAVNIKDLKRYSKAYRKSEKKELVNIKNNNIEDYNFGVVKNYILDAKIYEVYLFVESDKEIASSLLYKEFSGDFKANIYYRLLIFLIKGSNKNKILKKISFFIK